MKTVHRVSSKLHQFFLTKGRVEKYQKGMVLIEPSKPSQGVFFIEKGFIEVRSSKKNEEKIYAIYKPGELFPLLWALQGINKRFVYRAYTNCTVYVLPKNVFTRAISTDLFLAQEIIQHLSTYCNVFLERIDHLEIPRAYDRVVSRLAFFAKRFGRKKNDDITIEIPLTHEAIAESLSISRETTSRIMKRLKDEGFIQYANHLVTLKHKLLLAAILTPFFLDFSPDFYTL